MGLYIPVIAGTIVSLITVFVNYKISTRTIETNKNLNSENAKISAENAGKNRIIYEIERYGSPGQMTLIQDKLATGKYTVLNSFADPGSFANVVIVLGKIKP